MKFDSEVTNSSFQRKILTGNGEAGIKQVRVCLSSEGLIHTSGSQCAEPLWSKDNCDRLFIVSCKHEEGFLKEILNNQYIRNASYLSVWNLIVLRLKNDSPISWVQELSLQMHTQE